MCVCVCVCEKIAHPQLRNTPVLLQGIIIVLLFICQDCLSARGKTFPGQLTGYEQSPGATIVAANSCSRSSDSSVVIGCAIESAKIPKAEMIRQIMLCC